MKKETKNATIRLPESLADWLTKDGLSINQAIIEAAEDLRASKMAAMSELRGVFTTNEWCFFADSFGSTITPKAMRYNAQTILAHIEDSCLYDHLDERWGVEADSLKDKIQHLHAANIDAIYSRLDKLQASDLDINLWAKY